MQHQHRLQAGEAGRDHLGAAAEAGEEVRLHEPRRDAHVRREPFLVQVDRRAGFRLAEIRERRVVAAVVVDDGVVRDDVVAEHAFELGARVRPMRARRHEDRDVLGLVVRQLFEDRAQHRLARLRARDVAHGNRDLLSRTNDVSEWRPADRLAQRGDERRVRVVDGRKIRGLDDRHPFVGHVDVESLASVIEGQSHYLTVSNPSVISMLVPQGSLMNAIAMPSAGTFV